METCCRPGDIRKSLFIWSCACFVRLSSCFRRCPQSRRIWIFFVVCFVNLLFVISQVGKTLWHQDRRVEYTFKRDRGLNTLAINDAQYNTFNSPTGGNADFNPSPVPMRSNVVYITLKSKRLKPAMIRGTVRPKLRRKARKTKSDEVLTTQNKVDTLELKKTKQMRNYGNDTTWKVISHLGPQRLAASHTSNIETQTEPLISYIRIYSERAPPWFNKEDIYAMRFLADGKPLRIREVSYKGALPFLIFEGTINASLSNLILTNYNKICFGLCGIVKKPVDTSEVFAFHLDRVLGLNRSLPVITRKFSYLHDGQPRPVVLWDASLYPEGRGADQSTVRLTWGEYQSSLKHRCWDRNVTPKPDSPCSTILHYEWSKLALFDFLMQIYHRLDRSCCGFKPRQEDRCVELGHHAACGDWDSIPLANVLHRDHDTRHLVFTDNKGFFDRDEENLDFRLLEGIKELPEKAVEVLRSRRLRQKLLQSLFLDQVYWESQGGRQGIEQLIDVIESRAKVLLTYINAHGIKLVHMDV
ncbi:Golgi-associated kinase 1B [Aplochiton taeniatus]